jgi:hypothetical protein
MAREKVVHVGFVGRELRRLEELQIYVGHARELGGPETVSETVRFAVGYCHRRFDRAARRTNKHKGDE